MKEKKRLWIIFGSLSGGMNLSWMLSATDIFPCAPCAEITYLRHLSVSCSGRRPLPASLHKGTTFLCSPAPPTGMPWSQLQELNPLHWWAGGREWEKELLKVQSYKDHTGCSKTEDFFLELRINNQLSPASGEPAISLPEAAWMWPLPKICPANKETEISVHLKILETPHREE